MDNPGVFINAMTDFGFKRLFGTEQFKPVLIRFLNVFFKEEGISIKDVSFHNKEILPQDSDGKRIVYDVYCTTPEDKEHFILEMQQVHHANLEKRIMYYLARIFAEQGHKGDNYDYKPVFGLFFVDFQFSHLHKKDIHEFLMAEKETHQVFSDVLRLFIISLIDTKPTWDECTNDLEKISYIIKNMHLMDKDSKAYKSGEYKELFDAAEIHNMAAEDIVLYSQSARAYEDLKLYRESGYNQGLEEGRADGRVIGRAEGRAEGITEGKAEGIAEEKVETAKKLKMAGMDSNFIYQITGLSPEQY